MFTGVVGEMRIKTTVGTILHSLTTVCLNVEEIRHSATADDSLNSSFLCHKRDVWHPVGSSFYRDIFMTNGSTLKWTVIFRWGWDMQMVLIFFCFLNTIGNQFQKSVDQAGFELPEIYLLLPSKYWN